MEGKSRVQCDEEVGRARASLGFHSERRLVRIIVSIRGIEVVALLKTVPLDCSHDL